MVFLAALFAAVFFAVFLVAGASAGVSVGAGTVCTASESTGAGWSASVGGEAVLAAAFLVVVFFAAAFLAVAFLAVVFLAVVFLAVAFFAVAFLAVFLAGRASALGASDAGASTVSVLLVSGVAVPLGRCVAVEHLLSSAPGRYDEVIGLVHAGACRSPERVVPGGRKLPGGVPPSGEGSRGAGTATTSTG